MGLDAEAYWDMDRVTDRVCEDAARAASEHWKIVLAEIFIILVMQNLLLTYPTFVLLNKNEYKNNLPHGLFLFLLVSFDNFLPIE